MATLHVRNVPDKLYKRIHKLAEAENRSVTAEVIRLLSQGVQAREARQGVADVLTVSGGGRKRSNSPAVGRIQPS